MTDAAVIADSAPAPAPDVGGAPIGEGASLTAPLGSQIPPDAVAKPAEPKVPASLDDSIDRAIAKSAAAAKEPPKADVKAQPEAKEPVKVDQPRENGKFAAKDSAKAPVADSAVALDSSKSVEAVKPSHTADDAPARFTETAKAKWASADPEIRGEVVRMQRELTEGYQKHKAAAERDGTLNEFHEMAKASGKELPNVVREYVNMENLLRKDIVGGLDSICQRVGLSLKDVAAHVLGQTPDQNASQQDATIRELKQELAGLKEQVGGVTKTFEQQQRAAEEQRVTDINTQIDKWKADKPLFELLAPHIADELTAGAPSLDDAYKAVLQKHPQLAAFSQPATASDVPAASSAAPDLSVQPDKGQKSINGAPSSGLTSPRKKGPAPSLDEALDRAFG